MRITGNYQKLGEVNYFIPKALPPKDPALEMTAEIIELYGEALFALGKLNEMYEKLPDPKRFVKAYVIKEALLTSDIEGIHTTLIEAFTKPLNDSHTKHDTQLVLNYSKAMDAALDMIVNENFPLVTRVILKAHETLMNEGESSKSSPGAFRKQSVKVGNLVPPPATEIPNLMKDLETYMNTPSTLPSLIQAGLAHAYFETIHPFLDGNGRIGRLLIVLMLMNKGILNSPILYPSYYFKKHHLEYYQRLDRVRTHGDFEGWIVYYLKCIKESAIDANTRARDIEDLEKNLLRVIHENRVFLKTKTIAQDVLNFLWINPVATISQISQSLQKAYNTIGGVLKNFEELNIVTKSHEKRGAVYRFDIYLELLEKEYF